MPTRPALRSAVLASALVVSAALLLLAPADAPSGNFIDPLYVEQPLLEPLAAALRRGPGAE